MKKEVVAIDGPPGSGKTTVAKMLAERLGYAIIDTGAMYRAVALLAIRKGVGLKDERSLVGLIRDVKFEFRRDGGSQRILINGEDVEDEIRTEEMGMAASDVSKVPIVREILVEKQRELGQSGRVICEGRDATTVIFPDAAHRFFLDASVHVRAARRMRELISRGEAPDFSEVLEEVIRRDIQDSTREHSPLKLAEGVVYVDTSRKSAEEVVETISRFLASG